MTDKIRLICATREGRDSFFVKTALGRSLTLYSKVSTFELRLFERNVVGLPQVYNTAIEESKLDPALLVFLHDDLHVCDFFWGERLREGLETFSILGLAGNKRRVPKQPGWAFVDDRFTWDHAENLSGTVGHGTGFPCDHLSAFGPSRLEVRLLDGLLLACRSSVLHEHSLAFDERFDFHLYDVDFCRQAEQKGLRMGTWPLSVVHESGGAFGSPAWKTAYRAYLDKWDE